jgi:DNA-binding transcriptional ArsR family regulator
MRVDELAGRVEELAERVSRLEGHRTDSARMDASLVRDLLADLGGAGGSEQAGAVLYAGAGPWSEGTLALQIVRGWQDVLDASEDALARVMSALANPTRIRIVGELLQGPVATGELAERLEQPSAGQLFHHLKELLAAGIIHQPVRGTYAIGDRHVVPLLVLGSAAMDLSVPAQGQGEDSP